jgi:hypothetical protein
MRSYRDEGRRSAILVMVMVSRAMDKNMRPTSLWKVPFTAFVIYIHLAVA